MKVFYSISVLLLFFSLHSQADLLAEQAYVRGMPPGQMNTAAFMRLVNSSANDIVINGASTQVAKTAEIHTHRHNNGMMRMEKVEQIIVPAGGEFILKPGGHHLMLIGLQRFLTEGETVNVQLQSDGDMVVDLVLPVRSVLNESSNTSTKQAGHKHH